MITTQSLASALIAVFEGCRLTAYQDSGGVWTIGFGRTRDVHEGMTITQDQAVQFLAEDSKPLFDMVTERPVLEAAALVSFGYNVGPTALKRVLAGTDTVDNPRHTQDRQGNVRAGLVSRRRLESVLIQLSKDQAS